MFSLLIVDDEYFIREGLSKDVDWASIGVKVTGTAQNGRQAIALIDQLQPDILLADISMSTMSGVEMAEKLREARNDIKIIFLSGYDDFHYAQKAIELKIFDYLLKPALMDDLLSSVGRAVEEVKRERSLKSRIDALEHNLAAGRLLAQEKFFEDAANPALARPAEWEARAQTLGIPAAGHLYCVALLELDEPRDGSPQQNGRLLAAKEIAEEYRSLFAFSLVMVRAPRLAMIVSVPAERGEEIDAALNTIRKEIRSLLSTTCTIGAGRTTDSVHGVYECWAEADSALADKIGVGKDCVIHFTDIAGNDKSHTYYPKTEEKRLLEALGSLDEAAIGQSVTHFIDALFHRHIASEQIRAMLAELISVLTRRFLELNVDLYDSFREFWLNPTAMLEKFRTPEQIRGWIANIVLAAAKSLAESRKDNVRVIVEHVQRIIRDDYAKLDLSLPMLAERVYLSPTYLSKLYKQETGETYVEYLTRVRMDEAKKLLKASNMKASEVGLLVGYPNAQYFSFLFKKNTGMSPIEYRELGITL